MAHMHAGHRSRLRRRFAQEGLDNFEPHEVLELLLYHAIPQRDVNPLAHALIRRFGSLGQVLGASERELMQVDGVGERTAVWLCSLKDMVAHYRTLTLSDRPKLGTLRDVSDYCVELLMDARDGEMWLFSMNMAGYLVHSAMLTSKDGESAQVIARRIADLSIRYRAQCFVLVQRRQASNMRVSPEDIALTQHICDALYSIRIPMIDHLLICGHRVKSLREKGILYPEDAESLGEQMPMELFTNWLE